MMLYQMNQRVSNMIDIGIKMIKRDDKMTNN